MLENHQKNIATCIHLSTFSRFIIPLGNYLGPIILWVLHKDKSDFINKHGKQAINFQLSLLVYTTIIGLVTIPFFAFNLLNGFSFNGVDNFNFSLNTITLPFLLIGGFVGFVAVVGLLLEFIFIIIASIKAKEGEIYKYPLTINFLK